MTFWTVLWNHRHGVNVYHFFQEAEPQEEEVLKEIAQEGLEFEPDREEYIEVTGPWETPE